MEKNKYRKPNRLKNYDYSSPGYYFITICTKHRESILWNREFREDNGMIKNRYSESPVITADCEAKKISRVELFRRVLSDIKPVGVVPVR